MIALIIQVHIAAHSRRELLQMLEGMKAVSVDSGHVLRQRIFEEIGRPEQLLIVQHLASEDALNAYQASQMYRSLLGGISVLGELEDLRIMEASAPAKRDKHKANKDKIEKGKG